MSLEEQGNASSPIGWPLSPKHGALVESLGTLIRRAGAERFLSVPIVRADERDFPDGWEPTRFAVERLLYRLFWHAYLDVTIEVEDRRRGVDRLGAVLESSAIEFVAASEGRAMFRLEAIGNDDIVGVLSHEIGAAFLALSPSDPFREAPSDPTPAAASAAAIYLGLGVLIANSSLYVPFTPRHGNGSLEQPPIATAGGLSLDETTLLLAVQALFRGDTADAFATLRAPQADMVARWRDVLDDHKEELHTLLELELAEPRSLARPSAPRTPAQIAEPEGRHRNHGRTTFRVPLRLPGRMLVGIAAGLAGFALPLALVAGPALMCVGGVAGYIYARRRFVCSEPDCRGWMASEVPICPHCGGTIADTIAHADLRLEKLEEIERS